MKSKAVSGIMLTLLLIGMLILTLNIQSAKASGTIYIRADGSIEGTTDIWTFDNVTYTFTGNINDSIVVERDNIVLDGAGYTLRGTWSAMGLDLTERNNITVRKMGIDAFHHGIYLYASSNINVTGNDITNNHNGIYFAYSSNNTVSENNITDNADNGVYLLLSSNNTFYGNTVAGNWYFGIVFDSSSYNCISGNIITFSPLGILLFWSTNNNVTKNNIAYTSECAIKLEASNDNRISGNDVTTNNNHGILLEKSSTNILSENDITNNNEGILLEFSENNTIIENNITNNYNGIYLGESTNNYIYHNNFRSNTKQVYTCDSTNVWDDGYPYGGNYWSDYEERYPNATEIDRTGIWDTPYVIDENNQDTYPLMNEGGKFEPYVSTFHLLFKDESHNLLGNLTGELRITEPEKGIIHSICKLSLSSPRPDEYHEPYIDKVELFTAWTFIIHPWGPNATIPIPPPYPQEVTVHVDEDIILFEKSRNVSDFVEEPRLIFWFSSGTKISKYEWGTLILPTIRVYFSDGQKWEWEYEYDITPPFKLWSGMEANLSELGGKIETASITFTTVEKVSPPIIDLLTYLYIILASTIIVAIAVAVVYIKKRKRNTEINS